jgi:LPXTG-motif cell wall-anchored protein
MNIVLNIIGVLIGLMGLVWFLQGINILQGSSLMSGQSQWAVIGAIALVVGVGLVFFANRRKNTPVQK